MQEVIIRKMNTNKILSSATFESLTNGLQIWDRNLLVSTQNSSLAQYNELNYVFIKNDQIRITVKLKNIH